MLSIKHDSTLFQYMSNCTPFCHTLNYSDLPTTFLNDAITRTNDITTLIYYDSGFGVVLWFLMLSWKMTKIGCNLPYSVRKISSVSFATV